MNAQYVPRDYMDAGIEAVFDHLRRVHSTLVVWATGVGKTELYLKVAERFLDQNPHKKILMIANREELITQPAKRWRRNCNEWPSIEMADQRAESSEAADLFDSAPMNGRAVIASVQTLSSSRRCRKCTADCRRCAGTGKLQTPCGCDTGCERCDGGGTLRAKCDYCDGDGWSCTVEDCDECFEYFVYRMQKFKPEEFGLLIVDEAHHCPAETYRRIVRYFRSRNPGIKILGLTATPDRHDEEELGQVFESVAHEYNLPQPILDGWLTPVDQQFVFVEGLNLANVRTSGDLNAGDLEAEMTAEEVLHKVTTPLIERACGLEPGAIAELIRRNRLHDLPGLCTKAEPTLVHAAGVDHAERITEILNRYLPDAALCIVGTTPKPLRRDGLKRFEGGDYQFLVSCGVFLEGTDLPNVSIIGMARPTKSRALYSQMIGRGLRPLSGLVDGVPDAAERVRRIAQSAKPKCTVMDFTGNAGKHKLVSAADVLGGGLPDELVEGVKRKAARAGEPVDVLRALMEAKQRAEDERREQARRKAKEAQQQQEEAKKRGAARRAGIVAGASYAAQAIDPFDVMDVAAKREPGYHKGRKPTEGQLNALRRLKIDFPPDGTFWQARQLLDAAAARRKAGLATYAQVKFLKALGYEDADTYSFDLAVRIFDARKRPAEYEQKKLAEITVAADGNALTAIAKEVGLARRVLKGKRFERIVKAGLAKRSAMAV
jgi:superfamily II DNA or RNA helicase